MDEELRNLLQVKKLQDEVIILREAMPAIYDQYFKRSQSIQLKRLLKVQIDIPVTEITIPCQNAIPISDQIVQPKMKIEDIENDCKVLQKMYDFIK